VRDAVDAKIAQFAASKFCIAPFKFLLTLSLSQVACERSFSTLKNIKNRMRSTLSSNYLNSFMIMAVKSDLLMNLDCDKIIDKVAENSELLQKSLTN
jgi:hypothetical protein